MFFKKILKIRKNKENKNENETTKIEGKHCFRFTLNMEIVQ